MPQNAWSLLAFTILTQMSVGAFGVSEFIHRSYSRRFAFEDLNPSRFSTRLFVLLSALLAGVFSIFHLKNWAHAYHAFNNIKTSWVSKEMAFFFLFVFCVALLVLLSWRKIEANLLQRVLSTIGILSGILLIYSMAKIYMLPTIPSWNSWTTPGLYFVTVLLLGTLAVVVLYSVILTSSKSRSDHEEIRERWKTKTFPIILKLVLFYIVIGMLVFGFFTFRIVTLAEELGIGMTDLSPSKLPLILSVILFYVCGWILLFLTLKKTRRSNGIPTKTLWLVYGATVWIALAEIGGRYLFFLSFTRIGV
jgi:anaerobic dimethyl sulfoxide reductase subunit C (anchor subunit)